MMDGSTVSETIEQMRRRVKDKLDHGSDMKFVRGPAGQAEGALRDAYAMCRRAAALYKPLPQLVAYRLAHLLFRKAKNKETLAEVEKLFAEAAESRALAFHSLVYRLSALHRLRDVSAAGQKALLDRKILDVHVDCIRRLSETMYPASESKMVSDTSIETDIIHRRSQNRPFNLLELATYFLGVSYEPLQGLGNEIVFGPEDWIIVGPDPALAAVRYSREMCQEELDERGKTCSEAFLFRLPDISEMPMIRPPYGSWVSAKAVQPLKLLSHLLTGWHTDRRRLRRAHRGDDLPTSTRVDLERLKRFLGKQFRIKPKTVITSRRTAVDLPVLNPKLRIYGAVHRSNLESR